MRIIKLILNILLVNTIYFLDCIIPKNKKLILFGSSGGRFSNGNPLIIFKYLKENNTNNFKIYYILNPDSPSLKQFNKNEILLKSKKNFKLIYKFIRAKFLIGSHGDGDFLFTRWGEKKIYIQTWHGIPLKKMGFADNGVFDYKILNCFRRKITYFLVSSELEASLISRCFNLNSKKIVLTGHSRVSIIKKPVGIKKIDNFSLKSNRIILYAPTYRPKTTTRLFPFKDFNINKLNNFLVKNKALILIRTHPNDKVDFLQYSKIKRVINFDFNYWDDITSFLSAVDILITDYSSIYFDFLLLNRPIIFIPYDINEYEKLPGFLLDNYNFWTPGPKVLTFDKLLNEMKKIFSGKDRYKKYRLELYKVLHKYNDGLSLQRILKLIKSNINE